MDDRRRICYKGLSGGGPRRRDRASSEADRPWTAELGSASEHGM